MSDALLETPSAAEDAWEEAPAAEKPNAAPAPSVASPRVDHLAAGMAFLLGMTVVQRGIGLVRNVLFCRLLEPEDLGRWNLAFSFLTLAAPLAVLGLPGSFGRYAEYFRERGRLREFLRRTGTATAILALLACALIMTRPGYFSQVIFREAAHAPLTLVVGMVLAAAIAFNAMTELFTALRRIRVASMMHFVNSLGFALVALVLLAGTQYRVGAVLAGYGAACVAACLAAMFCLRSEWRAAPTAPGTLSPTQFWAKLLPFAGWIWVTNLLANLSSVVDRYMILYLAHADATVASGLVGQYHSSRVAPDLLASVASMLAAAMLPYNSRDWEAGDRRTVSVRVNLALKLVGLIFTAAGAAVLLATPLLFGWALGGKYAAGEAVQPWALVLCIWLSLAVLAQSYLWCAERAGWATFAIGVGLVASSALNFALLPHLGLPGAVIATALGNGVMLVVTLWLNRRAGMELRRGVVVAALAPLSLISGVAWAGIAVCALAVAAARTELVFSTDEKRRILAPIRAAWTSRHSMVRRT